MFKNELLYGCFFPGTKQKLLKSLRLIILSPYYCGEKRRDCKLLAWVFLLYLLADMNFCADGVWPVIRHQLINYILQILLNQFLALTSPKLQFITVVVQLGFDFILRK